MATLTVTSFPYATLFRSYAGAPPPNTPRKPFPPRLHAAMTLPQPWRKLPTMPRKSASPEAAETSPVADFEASLDALEQLVEKIEHGELSLEQSLAGYERGVGLYRRCQQALEQAELRGKLTRDRKSTRMNSSHQCASRMPSS